MSEKQTTKCVFDGVSEDNSFFKTSESKSNFIKDIKESVKEFIDDQDKRKVKSIETSIKKIF